MPNVHTTPRTPHEIVTGSKFNFLTDLLCPFGVPILVVGGDVIRHQNPANAQGVCLGDAPDTKGGVLTLLPKIIDQLYVVDFVVCRIPRIG